MERRRKNSLDNESTISQTEQEFTLIKKEIVPNDFVIVTFTEIRTEKRFVCKIIKKCPEK